MKYLQVLAFCSGRQIREGNDKELIFTGITKIDLSFKIGFFHNTVWLGSSTEES